MGMDWVEVDRDRFVVGALVNTVQNFQGRKFLGQLSFLRISLLRVFIWSMYN
jgi:hypothetical protein